MPLPDTIYLHTDPDHGVMWRDEPVTGNDIAYVSANFATELTKFIWSLRHFRRLSEYDVDRAKSLLAEADRLGINYHQEDDDATAEWFDNTARARRYQANTNGQENRVKNERR